MQDLLFSVWQSEFRYILIYPGACWPLIRNSINCFCNMSGRKSRREGSFSINHRGPLFFKKKLPIMRIVKFPRNWKIWFKLRRGVNPIKDMAFSKVFNFLTVALPQGWPDFFLQGPFLKINCVHFLTYSSFLRSRKFFWGHFLSFLNIFVKFFFKYNDFFQVITRFKDRKNKLEGRMRPAGLTLAMSALP